MRRRAGGERGGMLGVGGGRKRGCEGREKKKGGELCKREERRGGEGRCGEGWERGRGGGLMR